MGREKGKKGERIVEKMRVEQQEYEIKLISSISLYSYRVLINSFNSRSIIPSDSQLMMAEIRTQQN
jgi:hypothetical protein